MTLFDLIKDRQGFRKQSVNTWEGPCPKCGGTKRCIIWIHTGIFKCRECDFKGDVVKFLREVEGQSCPEAHQTAGVECESSDCPAFGKCSATRSSHSATVVRNERRRHLSTPMEKQPRGDSWQPSSATTPAEKWQEKAGALVQMAHETMINTPAALDYLQGRGLPRGAVDKNRLGWLPVDLYRDRESWGLAPEYWPSDQKKKLWLPPGIVIPCFNPDGSIFRIRIRLPDWKIEELRDKYRCGGKADEPPRYYWVKGSGDDTWITNRTARVFVIVESDLDGILVDWHAGDIAGVIPLGTCSARPHETAAKILDRADCILNALDYEPRINGKSGRHESPGGENWLRWWRPRYPQAKRHPVPVGKDPGEAYQEGVDIREWIISGLPLGLRP